jgi:hypothetical protein
MMMDIEIAKATNIFVSLINQIKNFILHASILEFLLFNYLLRLEECIDWINN